MLHCAGDRFAFVFTDLLLALFTTSQNQTLTRLLITENVHDRDKQCNICKAIRDIIIADFDHVELGMSNLLRVTYGRNGHCSRQMLARSLIFQKD